MLLRKNAFVDAIVSIPHSGCVQDASIRNLFFVLVLGIETRLSEMSLIRRHLGELGRILWSSTYRGHCSMSTELGKPSQS